MVINQNRILRQLQTLYVAQWWLRDILTHDDVSKGDYDFETNFMLRVIFICERDSLCIWDLSVSLNWLLYMG